MVAGTLCVLSVLEDPAISAAVSHHVTLLDLYETTSCLTPRQASRLCQLRRLRHLSLSRIAGRPIDARVIAALPAQLTGLMGLQSLYLYSSFNAAPSAEAPRMAVPSDLSLLRQLMRLELSGAEDCMTAVCSLPALRRLCLMQSGVTYTVPCAFDGLCQLTALRLEWMVLGGHPAALSKLTSLRSLRVARVQLDVPAAVGDFSAAVGSMAALTCLDLKKVGFDIPIAALSRLHRLVQLGLGKGARSFTRCNTWKRLRELDLSGNRLTGMPGNLTALLALTALDLSGQVDMDFQVECLLTGLSHMPALRTVLLYQQSETDDEDGPRHEWSAGSMYHLSMAQRLGQQMPNLLIWESDF